MDDVPHILFNPKIEEPCPEPVEVIKRTHKLIYMYFI
jgi:hypothetical protein